MTEWIKTAKVGDRIVCITKRWFPLFVEDSGIGPSFKEICVIADMRRLTMGNLNLVFFRLESHGNRWFTADGFRPIDPASLKSDRVIQSLLDLRKTEPVREDA